MSSDLTWPFRGPSHEAHVDFVYRVRRLKLVTLISAVLLQSYKKLYLDSHRQTSLFLPGDAWVSIILDIVLYDSKEFLIVMLSCFGDV
jgi:hypothetical protein